VPLETESNVEKSLNFLPVLCCRDEELGLKHLESPTSRRGWSFFLLVPGSFPVLERFV